MTGPSAPGARESINALSSPDGNSSPASIAAIISPMRSITARTALTSPASGARRPARQSASASSAAWLSASSRGKSKKPQLPFTVWTKRKMLSRRARSSGLASQATISPPSASSISRHSATKSAIRSSIGGRALISLQAPLCRQGVNGPLSLAVGQRYADQQDLGRGIAELDRAIRLRRQAVRQPGTRGARLDFAARLAGGDGLAELGIEQNPRTFGADDHLQRAVAM